MPMSRSTWACELKSAPRSSGYQNGEVTLHVSVWVEISWQTSGLLISIVTLHVSVWVEIPPTLMPTDFLPSHAPRERVSWNTVQEFLWLWGKGHAPRERVSWNAPPPSLIDFLKRHAPRERVSWNTMALGMTACSDVTLHVSVWVEILIQFKSQSNSMSRSTWACELKYCIIMWKGKGMVSRSTWACELKYPWNMDVFWQRNVTLHVSVWVEICSDR